MLDLEVVKDGRREEGEEQEENKEHKNNGDETAVEAAEDDGIFSRGERMAEERAKTEQPLLLLVFVSVGGFPLQASPPDHLRHRRRRSQRRRCWFLLN